MTQIRQLLSSRIDLEGAQLNYSISAGTGTKAKELIISSVEDQG
ncbi:hypothetical protein [Nitratireductor sp. PBL-C9]